MKERVIAVMCFYFAALVVAAAYWLTREIARALTRRKYRVRVVTICPSLSRAFAQQSRPVARGELDVPTARRVPMGDPLRTR